MFYQSNFWNLITEYVSYANSLFLCFFKKVVILIPAIKQALECLNYFFFSLPLFPLQPNKWFTLNFIEVLMKIKAICIMELISVVWTDKAERLLAEASSYGSQLVVFPEAFIGGYPRGSSFGVTIGNRTAKGREDFRKYHSAAIDVPGKTCWDVCFCSIGELMLCWKPEVMRVITTLLLAIWNLCGESGPIQIYVLGNPRYCREVS